MTEKPTEPITQTEQSSASTADKIPSTARRPSDHLDRDRESEETIPRKSSLL